MVSLNVHILVCVLISTPGPHNIDTVPELSLPIKLSGPIQEILRVKHHLQLIPFYCIQVCTYRTRL